MWNDCSFFLLMCLVLLSSASAEHRDKLADAARFFLPKHSFDLTASYLPLLEPSSWTCSSPLFSSHFVIKGSCWKHLCNFFLSGSWLVSWGPSPLKCKASGNLMHACCSLLLSSVQVLVVHTLLCFATRSAVPTWPQRVCSVSSGLHFPGKGRSSLLTSVSRTASLLSLLVPFVQHLSNSLYRLRSSVIPSSRHSFCTPLFSLLLLFPFYPFSLLSNVMTKPCSF